MSQIIGRNEPCPCGSGLKYKKCHWGEDQRQARSAPAASASEAPAPVEAEAPAPNAGGLNRNQIGTLLFALAIGGAIVLFVLGYWKWGIASAGAGSLLAGIVWVALDPPPPDPNSNKRSASGVNFGQPR